MRVNTRRLFALILLSQIGCLAVGMSFYYLYVSSALAQAQKDDAQSDLAVQMRSLTPELKQQDLASLRDDASARQPIVDAWQNHREANDQMLLVDPDGHVEASLGDEPYDLAAEPLKLNRSAARWGTFDGPIRGTFNDAKSAVYAALAQPLPRHDGYLLLTRSVGTQAIRPADIQGAMWVAGGITLGWMIILQTATIYMIISYTTQQQSRAAVRPEVEALKQAQALVRTQETVIFGLAKLSDSRDADTGSHLERIAHYSSALAAALRQRPDFREQIPSSFVQLIGISSALHDIGKVGVEDSILQKPGSLTPEERARMQRHTQIGEECLKEIERRLGSSNFLQMAREISSAHHERWDGSGYPVGLSGEQIPLSARIVAIADVYDALSRKRVYKEAFSHEECVEIISESAGSHFDPRVVEVFLQIHERFRQISEQFQTPPKSETDAADPQDPMSLLPDVSQYVIDGDFAVASTATYANSAGEGRTPN
jgi:HD-GYP domain-containing protein (c-di-GMP phosphodiesterase class II)